MATHKSNTDRRVRRTRRQLRKSLRSLLQSSRYTDITITTIVEHAQISRGTFYLHYQSKDDLLVDCFGQLWEDLVDKLQADDLSIWGIQDVIMLIVQQVDQNRGLYLELVSTEDIAKPLYKQFVTLIPLIKQVLQNQLDYQNSIVSLDLLVYQWVGAILSGILWWLEDENPIPPQQIVEAILQTPSLITQKFLPTEPPSN